MLWLWNTVLEELSYLPKATIGKVTCYFCANVSSLVLTSNELNLIRFHQYGTHILLGKNNWKQCTPSHTSAFCTQFQISCSIVTSYEISDANANEKSFLHIVVCIGKKVLLELLGKGKKTLSTGRSSLKIYFPMQVHQTLPFH